MNLEKLDAVLVAHRKWVYSEPGGERANLYGADLYGADLRCANLRGANLRGANLRGANLRGANLVDADLYGADLHGADLHGANLYGANLRDANLRCADLHGADLYGADLRGADLRGANLRCADLHGANLRGANLVDANLVDADLYGANVGAPIPTLPNPDKAVLAAIESGGTLNMAEWHTCDTTHCRAGWIVALSGAEGKALEDKLGTASAAALIYAVSEKRFATPDWYCSNTAAMDDLKERASA